MQLRCEMIKKKRKKLIILVIDPIPEASFYSIRFSLASLCHQRGGDGSDLSTGLYTQCCVQKEKTITCVTDPTADSFDVSESLLLASLSYQCSSGKMKKCIAHK